MIKWIEQFRDPEAKYRPHPFWSWNDKLEEGELRRQIREMKETGQGGFFMHARDGLVNKYMDDEWHRLVRACTDEAEKCGLEAWCYDELGWPSGSAGGAIPALGEEYRVRWLRLRKYEGELAGDVIGVFAVRDDNSYRKLNSTEDRIEEDERIMYATSFADESYFDILDPKVVRAFIDHTYEGYLKENGGDFGTAGLFGFFTDEPQYALCRTPWSFSIAETFRNTFGYDITDHIPALFLGRDGYEDKRYDFWSLVSRLFTESFGKQLGDWCEEHGTKLTGHVMMEDNMLCQIHCTAGCMPIYEYMHIPGIDWLGRLIAPNHDTGKNECSVITLQLGSVAAQTGKEQTLTETFAMSGWEISFAEMRHLIEWQFIGGINLVCQHLGAYSIRERRKGDYPPSMFHQSPWFRDYKAFSDTESRLGKLLSSGKDDSSVLLIHPMHSVWLKYTNDDMNAEQDFDSLFTALATRLMKAHVPYHLGDESIMARHGSVDGKILRVGKCSYSTVFLPDLMGLDISTYELLSDFKKNGGELIRIGKEIPRFISGRIAEDEIAELYDGVAYLDLSDNRTFMERIRKYYTSRGIADISVIGSHGEEASIQLCRRRYPEKGYTAYFLLNMDREAPQDVSIVINGNDAVEYVPDTATLRRYPMRAEKGKVTLDVHFAPMESHFIIVGDDLPEAPPAEYLKSSLEIPLFTGSGKTEKWRLGKDSDPNCCTLEYCEIWNGAEWSKKTHANVAGNTVENIARSGAVPSVRFKFTVAEGTDLSALSDMRAVCEEKQPYRLLINGIEASAAEGEWWLDHSFSVHSIGHAIKHGENEIILTDFCRETEAGLRPNSDFGYMYLTGEFGVFFDGEFIHCNNRGLSAGETFVLGDRPRDFTGGNIVTQGHPFFAGHIVLEKDIMLEDTAVPRHIELKKLYAACAFSVVNGKKGKLLAWGDLRDDVTDRIIKGRNTIGIELTVGNRNLLGPFHIDEAENLGSGPSDFAPYEPSRWVVRYGFEKAGLSD